MKEVKVITKRKDGKVEVRSLLTTKRKQRRKYERVGVQTSSCWMFNQPRG